MPEVKTVLVVSEKWTLNKYDWKTIGKNVLIFTAPALVVFFFQLSQGVSFKAALALAALVLYGVSADFFKKFSSETKTLEVK